jgi:hypothetical protein
MVVRAVLAAMVVSAVMVVVLESVALPRVAPRARRALLAWLLPAEPVASAVKEGPALTLQF